MSFFACPAACTAVRAFASCEEDDMRTLQVRPDVILSFSFLHLLGILLTFLYTLWLPYQACNAPA